MTVKHGYQPMHPPRKAVTQEQMWETLARHAKRPIQVPNATQSPKEKAAPIEWHKPVRTGERSGYVLSQCGGYSISKDVSGESVTYTAWKRLPDLMQDGKPWKQMPVNLGCVKTRGEAEALCEADRK